jgi:hypothetical protein
MQEFFPLIFVVIVAVGAFFAFKPKKTPQGMNRNRATIDNEQSEGEVTTPTVIAQDTASPAIAIDVTEGAPVVKRVSKPRKKYGTRGVKKAKK